MKKLILFATLSPLILACSCAGTPERARSGKTVIAGEVVNTPKDVRVLLVNFCNPLNEDHRYSEDLRKSGGSFHTEHEYFFSQNLTIRIENKFINLFVNPGDSVYLTIDARKVINGEDGAVTFSGDNAQFNEELYRWTTYAYSQPFPELDEDAGEEELLNSLNEALRNARAMIEEYAAANGMSEAMKQWAYNDYRYIIANNIMYYGDGQSGWRVFTDPAFDVFNESNFSSMYFPYHLGSCIGALLSGDENIKRLFGEEKISEGWKALTEKLQEAAPEGMVRDMMIYKLAYSLLDERPELYDSLPGLATFFSEPYFASSLENSVRGRLDKLASSPIAGSSMGIQYLAGNKVEELPEIELMDHLRNKYKGKVIYIDVWATWCVPCLEEMRLAPALHETFEGRDVVFVNLCLHSPPALWPDRIDEYIIEGENYFLDVENSNMFMGNYNLTGFPSYMILDRDGNLHSPAPRPSQPVLAAYAIEKHL